MKTLLAVLVVAALACLVVAALAAPDWQALTSQTARDEWTFWNASGTKADATYGYRAYIVGCADTSLAANRFDWTYSAVCTCFAAQDTMGNGTRRRSGRYDIYRISGGTDSLVVDNAYIEGRIAAKESVDDTSLVASSVGTSEVINYSLQSADYDTNSVGALALGSEAVGQDELEDNSVDSTNAAAGALSPTDLKAASAMAAGEVLIATGSTGADWVSTVGALTTTGTFTVGDGSGTDSVAIRGPAKQRDGYAFTSTGAITGATLTSTGTTTVGDGTGTDSLTVLGDIRARGGDIVAGTAGQAGTVGISDGSSNLSTLTGTAWGSNVTINTPFFFADFKLDNSRYHGTNEYSFGFYVAGVDTSWVAVPVTSAMYDPGGASEGLEFPTGTTVAMVTRPYYAYCKTDSVILTAHGCCKDEDALRHVYMIIGKKNLFRRAQ